AHSARMCHNLFAVSLFSHIDFTTNKEPRRLFSATSVSYFFGLFCYSPIDFNIDFDQFQFGLDFKAKTA
ncbi:MAG: hypothetical protein IJR65_02790, partial [Oscillospiraceae bacterium]|nr:hypothetical protein [Oscillospiraceae bacterium]